jgi:NAD-dependent SIR2 family protein deacetylase
MPLSGPMTAGPIDLKGPVLIPRLEIKTAVILGAGFSTRAGLPNQQQLAEGLFSCNHWTLDKIITQSIKVFVQAVFGWTDGAPLPALEDIFTVLDLSAGSGHNLGKVLTPKVLRAMRRFLIDRIFALIDRKFEFSPEIGNLIELYLPADLPVTTHFVVLNWDNVLERHIFNHDPKNYMDYRVRGRNWNVDYNIGSRSTMVAKVHGSSGWLYCDNCRTLFHSTHSPISPEMSMCVRLEDLELINRAFGETIIPAAYGSRYNPVMMAPNGQLFTERTKLSEILPLHHHAFENCRFCGCAVGPHIATFSFRKSFRTHASALSWQAAEEILSEAAKWIFIGYSLPDADIEFKHLIKTCQLKFAHDATKKKFIDVVVHKHPEAQQRYEKFFGLGNVAICQSGLEGYLKSASRRIPTVPTT